MRPARYTPVEFPSSSSPKAPSSHSAVARSSGGNNKPSDRRHLPPPLLSSAATTSPSASAVVTATAAAHSKSSTLRPEADGTKRKRFLRKRLPNRSECIARYLEAQQQQEQQQQQQQQPYQGGACMMAAITVPRQPQNDDLSSLSDSHSMAAAWGASHEAAEDATCWDYCDFL